MAHTGTVARSPRPPATRWFARLALALLAVTLLFPALNIRPALATDDTATALAQINQARAAIGIPPLKRSVALDQAASAHANYYRLNFGDTSLAGMGLHQEQAGKPGYTGVDFAARAKAAGYDGSINENIGLSGSILVSLDWFMGTVNHRLTLIDPRYTDIGFGVVNEGKAKIEVIDLGTTVWRTVIDPTWGPWPPPDSAGIGTRFDGEAPNPFPSARYPLGYPITLKYNGPGTVDFTAATLSANGRTVPALGAEGTMYVSRTAFIVAATAPLLTGTAYTVSVEGTANNQPFKRSWSFTTRGTPPPVATAPPPTPTAVPTTPAAAPTTPATPTPPAATVTPSPSPPPAALPAGVAAMDPAAVTRWRAADYDVFRGAVARTWTWGPEVRAATREPFSQGGASTRQVYYFDKSRMEINDPNADRSSPWFVTNGLLVRELISGSAQTGTATFEQRGPARIALAGDAAARNPACATYASLAQVASLTPGQNVVGNRVGAGIAETIDAAGYVGTKPELASAARYGAYDPTLGHNIADVFWQWLGAQPVDWVYATGFPLTEPYWTLARIDGVDTWVLVQAFERRVLTFVPGNPVGWQVEAGNVGLHYYEWRYGAPPK